MNWQSAGRAIWRYKWLAIGLTAWLVITTAIVVGRQAPEYEASSTVRIVQRVQPGDVPALETAARNAASYSVLINGSEFASLITEGLEEEIPDLTPQQVQGIVSAEPIPSTDLIVITTRGGEPERITQIANAATPALRRLAIQQGRTERIQLSDEARVPTDPVAPRLNLAIAVALIVGLIINGALMVLLDLLRDRFADPDELRAITGRPVLATVPQFARSSFGVGSGTAPAASDPGPTRPQADLEEAGS